jgi:hypothetical protein
MLMSNDDRIPVRLGATHSAGTRSHVLRTADIPAPSGFGGHVLGCTCCAPRSGLARALSRLFLAQMRGEVAPFDEVVVEGAYDAATLRAAIAEDVVAAARFRIG